MRRFKPADYCYSTKALENNIVNFLKKENGLELWLNMQYVLEWLNHYEEHIEKITSGYRNKELNNLVGGVIGSYHVYALAVDIRLKPIFSSLEFAKFLRRQRDPRIRKVISYEDSRHLHISFWPDGASGQLKATYLFKTSEGKYIPIN